MCCWTNCEGVRPHATSASANLPKRLSRTLLNAEFQTVFERRIQPILRGGRTAEIPVRKPRAIPLKNEHPSDHSILPRCRPANNLSGLFPMRISPAKFPGFHGVSRTLGRKPRRRLESPRAASFFQPGIPPQTLIEAYFTRRTAEVFWTGTSAVVPSPKSCRTSSKSSGLWCEKFFTTSPRRLIRTPVGNTITP